MAIQRKKAKSINFVYVAPEAKNVSLIRDFNDWNPTAHPMKRRADGARLIQVPMNHGHHHYQYCVDGKSLLASRAKVTTRNENNENVSLVAIS
jgi:1,4-alpha-glucan branching enzyme